jgi:hypothetical protein
MACHRKRVTFELSWWILKHHHRSGLICDEKLIVIELFWHAWQGAATLVGAFYWRCFPRVHDIAGCIGDGLGTCHLLIAQCGHLWFLHVSGSYWTTCQVHVVPHVSFLLAHVSCYGWITCHFFIGLCFVFLLVHVAISYSTTCHDAVLPSFVFLFSHVASQLPSTCWVLAIACVMHWFVHVSYFYLITWLVLVLPHGV